MRVIDILEEAETAIQKVANRGVNANDIAYVDMYKDYYRLMKEQHQKKYIELHLCEQYNLSRSGLYKIIKRLNKRVK